jgi:2-phosphosulfolactate phosphatase
MAEDPSAHVDDPFSQSKYQVRFDHGAAAASRIADGADIAIWVDALGSAGARGEAASDGVLVHAPAPTEAPVGVPRDFLDALAPQCAVVASGLVDAPAVAAWILTEQERLGRRAYIAIVAAGESRGAFDAAGVLAAGALIDALTELGIDDTAPEAAVACAAFVGLRRAVGHLVTASGTGRSAVSAGASVEAVRAAGRLGSSSEVRVVRAPDRV